MCPLLAQKAPWWALCPPLLSLGRCIFKVLCLNQEDPRAFCHEAAAGQGPSYGITLPTGGCLWGVGSAAPLGAARH